MAERKKAEQKKAGTRQERKRAEQGIRRIEARGGAFVKAVEATRMPMVVTDPRIADNPIVYANPSFIELCGYSRDEVLGHNYHFLSGPSTEPEVRERIDRAVNAREDIVQDVLFYRKDGRQVWVSQFVSPTVENDRIVQHFASFIDITDRVEAERRVEELNATLEQQVNRRTQRLERTNRRLEEEVERRRRLESVLRDTLSQDQEHLRQKEFLINEVHHRTKNALAMASSLLRIQAGQSKSSETQQALATAIERLSRISEVYGMLAQGATPDRIEVADYLRQLSRTLLASFQADTDRVRLTVDVDEVTWGADMAVPLGLIVNEAMTNAMKYAFPEGRRGRIGLHLQAAGAGLMRLCIEDDGVGLAPDRRQGALGLELIGRLVEQIDGRLKVDSVPDHGVRIDILFPDPTGEP